MDREKGPKDGDERPFGPAFLFFEKDFTKILQKIFVKRSKNFCSLLRRRRLFQKRKNRFSEGARAPKFSKLFHRGRKSFENFRKCKQKTVFLHFKRAKAAKEEARNTRRSVNEGACSEPFFAENARGDAASGPLTDFV